MTKRRAIIAAIVLVGIVVLAAGAYSGYRWWQQVRMYTTFESMESLAIAGDDALILHPEQPNGGAILVTHGSGADAQATRLDYMSAFTQDLLDDGWIVASADAEGEAWGSAASQDDYAALGTYLVDEESVDRIVVVSFSMGAIAGLNITATGAVPNQVGWVGVNPVTNLEAIHADARFTGLIDAALTPAERGEVDPALIPADRFTVPLLIFSGVDDTTVPGGVHGVTFGERVGATVKRCDGAHLSIDCFRADALTAIFG